MNEIKEQVNNHLEKMKIMESFISLSLRREKIDGPIRKLVEKTEDVRKLTIMSHELMQNDLENLEAEYESVMRRMRRQQAIILDHVLKEKKKKLNEAEKEEQQIQAVLKVNASGSSAVKSAPSSAMKSLELNFGKMQMTGALTPKISIGDYMKSPMVKRTKPNIIPFVFLEFEVEITMQQFEKIPKYMRGRVSLDELTNFLETVIVACFNEKYKLLHRQRAAVRNPNELDLWKIYNEQASYIADRRFITPGDISRKINKMIDKKIQNRLVMLRHIGILQEQRVSQTICYVWAAN